MIVEKCIKPENIDGSAILHSNIVEKSVLVAFSCCNSGKKMVTF